MKLHFSRMPLLPGDYVTVSDPAGAESYRYERHRSATSRLLAATVAERGRWAMSVNGDTAILELHRGRADAVTSGRGGDRLGVVVDQVARGNSRPSRRRSTRLRRTSRHLVGAAGSYRAPDPSAAGPSAVEPVIEPGGADGVHAQPGRSGREESVCGGDQSRDAVCYRSSDPVAYTRSKAIARLLINGTELCTGWRLGPKNRMLTNNHCLDNSADAYETEVWFNYQCAVACGGTATVRPTKVWGDRVLATNQTYDYTVFTVEQFQPDQDLRLPCPGCPPAEPQRGPLRAAAPGRRSPPGSPGRGREGRQLPGRRPAYDGYAKDSDVSYYCDTDGRLVGFAGALPGHPQGGGAAPLRRLPQLRRPRRHPLQQAENPPLTKERWARIRQGCGPADLLAV